MGMIRMNHHLPEPVVKKLKQRAKETGLSLAELIRRAVEEYLNKTGK